MYRVALAAMFALLAIFSPSSVLAQALPQGLRSAGVTQEQWDAIHREARIQAQRAHISEVALISAAEAASANFASSGRFDAATLTATIFDAISEQANQIAELQRRLDALTGDMDTSGSALIAQARSALNEGRLADADTSLAQAVQLELASIQAADAEVERRRLRAGDTIAARAQVAYVQADYITSAQHYARAAETVPQSAILQRGRYTIGRGASLVERGRLFGEPEALEKAVAAYQSVLSLQPISREDWGAIQNDLAGVYALQGERGVPGALKRALTAYEAVLTVSTRATDPVGWASTASNIGAVLSVLGERGEPGALERSVLYFEGALRVRTREADPDGWADTQSNLGNALIRLGEFDRAIAAYQAALTINTREANPEGWAMAMSNLGVALTHSGQLERAVATYEEVLTVRTRETATADWATTQLNLGGALGNLGLRGNSRALERAVAAFQASATVMTRESDPAGWAGTQMNLAMLYEAMGRIREARAAARTAQEVFEQVGDANWVEQASALLSRLPAE